MEGLRNSYFIYRCSNCQVFTKTFSLALQENNHNDGGTAYKYGESPPFGPPTPARLISLAGPDRDAFLKGRRCENQGLGIGAFIYYRRVVENQKARIITRIADVAERLQTSPSDVQKLRAAATEDQFAKAMEMAKPYIPQSLLIDGHNPLGLLHSALSDGVHAQADEHCLALATSIRVVLAELSDRMTQLLKDEAELKHALSIILKNDAASKSEEGPPKGSTSSAGGGL
ncbi:hypothetical protein [Roseimicrobium gellanilyticum]|uniref:hypothetical protein n=1 Tax=Roseimicrobium gellanilyticum TaxID=748857 RepID=UPI001B86894D|nr:hypothetical protein [Roseimicrobium gellanilyticum]